MSITKYINLGKDKALTNVSGEEGLYNPFYRFFVLRKRQELISPRFFNMGDIVIPYNSVFHYLPNDVNSGYRGPGNHEPFISNYDKDVYIEFFSDFAEFETMGAFRRVIMEERKEIKAYRANHFNYKYTRNIEPALRKEKNLIVRNYGLIDKRMVYRPHMFINYFIYYNRTNNLIENINLEAERSNRHQFIRLDLGNRLFSWQELMVDYDAYCNAFKTGKYEPTNRSLRITKPDNSYWILDFMAYLLGDYRYSAYGKLSEKAASNLHLLITHNAKVLVIKYDLLKEWLDNITTDPLADKPEEWQNGSRREFSTKRVNVTKRLYLLLLNMVNGATTEEQLTEETLEVLNEKEEEEREEVQRLVPTTGNKETGDGGTQGGVREEAPDVDDSADTNNVHNDGQGTKRSDEERDRDQAEETGDDEGGETSADLYSISWDSEVDDKLLEVEEVKEVEQVVEKEVFKTPVSGVERALKNKARDGTLTVREQEYFLERGKRYKEIKMENGQTMEEFMEIKPDTIDSLKEDAKIKGNFVTVLDESMLQSRSGALKKGYVEKILDKHLVQMVVGIQNAGIVVNDFKKETIVGVEGSYDILNIQMQPVGGSVSTTHVRLPKVLDDSTFVVDGVKNHMQLQRMELPIRKIAPNLVVLTSYYPSKIMVSRDERTVNDISYWLPKQLIKLSVEEDSKISFDRGSAFNPKLKPPRIISALSKKFKWVKVGNITLDFRFDLLIEKHPEFKKYNKPDSFLIGVNRGEPITIDNFGVLRIGNKEHNTIEEFLGVDTSKMPKEFCVVNISGYKYPVGVLLCYYFGIDELLKVLKTNYRVEPVGPRLVLGPDEYALTFSDEHLIFNRRDSLSTLVFAGLAKFKNLRNFSRTDLNSQGIWVPLIDDVKVKPSHFTEMNNLFDLFIDPITKAELTKLKYSTSFHHLLIDAVKLLETDFSLAGSDITEQRIVGYERITGHLYREMCNSVRAYRNKGNSRKFKLEMNPDIVLAKILTDTSVTLVEQVNPIHELKDQEELTFGGVGGRNEISVVLRDRIKLAGDKGILGEGGKDSGKAGFVNYLTADPRITDYSGNIATNEKNTISGLRTSTGNLAVSTAKDD